MKKILIFLLAAVMLFSAFACTKNNGKTPAESTPEGTTTEKEVYVSSSVDDPDEPDGILIANEGASKYVIVRGANASASEVTASTELQSYLKKITKVELPIVTDDVAEAKYEIVVGKTNREEAGEFDRAEFGDDGFVIKVIGKKLYLVGSEVRGTLYSVYTFLEEYLGCRYYTADVEKIPTMSTILLDENMPEDKQIPVFSYRDTNWEPSYYGNYAVKQKINGICHTLSEANGGNIVGGIGHSFFTLVPPSVYAAEHPEYFSDGKGQICLTNPEVVQIAIESARKILNDNPSRDLMPIGQEDNSNYCKCDGCTKALEEENGLHSGVLLRFVNAIANALKDEFPDVLFTTFAYSWTQYCPTTSTKLADNVVLIFCTLDSCYSHPHRDNESNGCKVNPDWELPVVSTNLPAWDNITENIIVWDYTTNFYNYNSYFPNLTVLLDNVKFFAENGVSGVFEQGNSTTGGCADFAELRTYIISKILWDPNMTEEEYWAHVDDFLQGYYGASGEYLREYIDWTEAFFDDECFSIYEDSLKDKMYFSASDVEKVNPAGTYPPDLTADMIRNYTEVDWSKYANWYNDLADTAYLDKAEECFTKALDAAESDEIRTRLEKVALQVDSVKSIFLSKRKSISGTTISKILTAFFDAHPNEFTEDEKSTLKNAISSLSKTQISDAYAAFNAEFRDNLLKHGIISVAELNGDIRDINKLNLANTPKTWYVG